MKPTELLERLRVLSECTGQAQTVLIAPGLPNQATSWVSGLSNSRMEGHVTAADLQEFIKWVESHEYKS